MAAPGLGLFANLPVEIRLIIWEEFLPLGYKRGGKTDLAILRTSKQLHAEIQDYLHKKMAMVTFIVRSKFDGMHQRVDSETHLSFEMWGGPDLMRAANAEDEETFIQTPMWKFDSAQDALSRGFQYLPLNKLSAIVCVVPPDPEDQGQLICLCLRMQQLVELLRKVKYPICRLSLHLGKIKQWKEEEEEQMEEEQQEDPNFNIERWLMEQEEECGSESEEEIEPPNFNLSLGYPIVPADLSFTETDIDAAMFPIYRLDNVEAVILDVSSAKLIFPCSKLPFHLLPAIVFDTSKAKLRELSPHEFPADLEGWSDMYNYYLHSRLDAAEGRTARLLRLDRFAHWKEYEYDEMFLQLLKKYPIQLDILDSGGFRGIRTRYIYAHTLRYYVSRSKHLEDLPTEADLRNIAPNIPLHHWRNVLPRGLPRFNIYVRTLNNDDNDPDFWRLFESYAANWIEFQHDSRQRQQTSLDLPAPVDVFEQAIVDAYDEWERLYDAEPDIEEKLLEEFGIRRTEIPSRSDSESDFEGEEGLL